MSFSSAVKEELAANIPSSRHCTLAQLSAMLIYNGHLEKSSEGEYQLRFQTENTLLAKKFFTLLEKTFNMTTDVCLKMTEKGSSCYCVVKDKELLQRIIGALKLDRSVTEQVALLTGKSCCDRSFLSGAFLSAGSISDPQSSYHFEIVCESLEYAELIMNMINGFDVDVPMDAKIAQRKKHYIVYVKEGSQIVDMLNLMGAHKSLMEMENLRAMKEMRNGINRRVNCEAANINKTVAAAVKQTEDIIYIRDHGGFSRLNEQLLEMAELRLENPEANLKELGEMIQPPVGKSGVNHRLRKLSELAQSMREQER